MASILLLENGSRHTRALAHRLSDYGAVVRLPYRHLTSAYLESADLIVLSGGHPSVIHHYWFFRRQFELIRQTQTPILGICLGFELIAKAYGSTLVRLPRKVHGLRHVTLRGLNANVWEAHRWAVSRLPNSLIAEGTSATGVELFRHVSKPMLGCQFHPEVAEPANDGPTLLDQFIRELLGAKSQKR